VFNKGDEYVERAEPAHEKKAMARLELLLTQQRRTNEMLAQLIRDREGQVSGGIQGPDSTVERRRLKDRMPLSTDDEAE
jgi:hypothetical protein